MQTTSDLYKELLAKGAAKEVRVEVDGQIYDENDIVELSTTASLFLNDVLSVGGSIPRQIDLTLKNYGNIKKAAKIIPSYRLVDGEQSSEWIQKGVFYIDTRQPDKASGTLTIHGFDAMLKGSVLWEPSQDLVFPMTFRAAAQVIANLMGVELDNAEDINDTYQILDYPANNYTQRNILQFIAAAHGANFIMTDLGKLRMVGINDIPVETSTLVNERGNAILIGGVRISVGSSTENNLTGDGSKVFVGGMVASTGAPPAFDPITRVIVKVDEENAYFSGDETGRTLEVTCPYGTQDMADNILAKVKGYVYQPFTAEDALVDQAIELGDGITVDGVYTILAKQDILFDSLMAGLVAAPGQEEIESEYPYQTKEQQVDLRLAQAYSLISKTAEEIRLLVEQEVGELDKRYTELKVTLDGVTVTDETGTTRIRGSSIETDTLYVNAANIRGTLTADQIVLSGSITWEDLDSTVQNNINSAGGISASEARTIINSTLVSSPNIAGAKFWDLDQDTWLEIDTVGGVSSMKLSTADGVAFSIGLSDTLGHFSMGAAGWPFLNVYESWNEVHPNGSWNFSQAPFIGVVNFSGANYVDMTGTEVDFTGSTITGLTPRFAS